MQILIITPVFPALDIYIDRHKDPYTKFLFDYAVQWAEMGHNILVFNTIPKYPFIFPLIVPLIEVMPKGYHLQLNRFLQNKSVLRFAKYNYKNIDIIRIPILKLIPHRNFLKSQISSLSHKINSILRRINWQPHLIISDFVSPSLRIASKIKTQSFAPIVQIFHQTDINYINHGNSSISNLLREPSCFLYRSLSMKEFFKRHAISPQHWEFIYSGIPRWVKFGHPKSSIRKFLYVGNLRFSKNVHILIESFASASIPDYCTLEIVGDGPDQHHFVKLAESLKISQRVIFSGQVSRQAVLQKMLHSDCLIMVSRETFGMVYIEAMSQGCIVVAAKGQGIDGIIMNGTNGFLIPLDDPAALSNIIRQLHLMPYNTIHTISNNAINTALTMTENKLASSLLEKLDTIFRTSYSI